MAVNHKGKYTVYGQMAREEYLRTGNVSAVAKKCNLSHSTVTSWCRKYGWAAEYASEQRSAKFLKQFTDKLQQHIDNAGRHWETDLSVIKGLSDLVLSWQNHEDRRAADARREEREARAAEARELSHMPEVFLEHLEFIFKTLEKDPEVSRVLGQHIDTLTAKYKEYVAEKANN